jgi:flagellar hook-basal body complex protein FliE
MNNIDVNRVLSQIRALSEQAGNRPAVPAAKIGEDNGFGRMVSGALGKVSETGNKAEKLAQAFELGDPSADLAKVMVAQAQAQVSFRAVSEVRNRLVSAYQEIMNMPI